MPHELGLNVFKSAGFGVSTITIAGPSTKGTNTRFPEIRSSHPINVGYYPAENIYQ